ncbi:acyl-CoA dehydrogenase family protein [Rhodococcus jostii]|uniref:acyl-CoA dehydrogenase family protein n=1 Tax=Rhodococcus jostii TaxID=132919 RepID=UPI00365363A4
MSINAQERQALAEAVRGAASAGPREFLHDHGKPAHDDRLWSVLTEQMGLAALLIGEDEGGAGADVVEVAVVLEELARVLSPVPALSSLGMATGLLRVVGGPGASDLLSKMAAGELTATVAWPDPASFGVAPVVVANGSTESGASTVLSGHADFVLDGSAADIVLVPARQGDDIVVVSVDARERTVTRTAMVGLDLTRGLASFDFADTPGTVVGNGDKLQAALDIALVLVAAEQVGIAQQCHDCAVKWAKERVQFDRPIGQFQAIKHQLVDLLMSLELARSALDVAVAAADDYLRGPDAGTARALAVAASAAKARCGDAAVLVSDESLHIMGGVGFTWEHDAHLYFRRARTLDVLFGVPATHRTRFSTQLLQEVASVR